MSTQKQEQILLRWETIIWIGSTFIDKKGAEYITKMKLDCSRT